MVRNIHITPVMNGFICQIGCQQVVFNSIGEMTDGIAKYYRNPREVEDFWVKNALNKTLENPVIAQGVQGISEPCPSPARDRITEPAPCPPEREMSATEMQALRRR